MIKKVLIADDNQVNRDLLSDVLERFQSQGVVILTAVDGKKTLEVVEKEHPDLILLDVQMPEIDGYQVCEKIKGDPALKDIYVIMVTANINPDERRQAAVAGADEYITKPFDIRQVRERVQYALGIKKLP